MYLLATVATALVLLCLEGSNFIHHKIFHEKEDTDEAYEPKTKSSEP